MQELERLLDDDNDMADMYLGRRAQLEKLAALLPESVASPRAPRCCLMLSGIPRFQQEL